MNKKVSLLVLCTVLVSTLCNGTDIENNLSSNATGILSDEKQQQIQERSGMQEMQEKLTKYRIGLEVHKEVSKKFNGEIRILLSRICLSYFLLIPIYCYWETAFRSLTNVVGLTVSKFISFAALSIIIPCCISYFHLFLIFNTLTRKKKLEGYLAEDRIAIKSLGARLFKEELNLLLQEEENKEVRQLLFDILQTKKN